MSTPTRADVPYTDHAGRSPAQTLDLYLPVRSIEDDGPSPLVPLVVVIHGGAFAFGDKRSESEIVAAATAAGFAAASLNYRLSGEAPFPAGVQDVKAAVRWLRANAAELGLDPDRFAAWGTSAGGHLSAMLGTTGAVTGILDDPALGHAEVSSAVAAVVSWYGPSDFATMDAQAIDPGGCPGRPQQHDPADSPESRWLGAPVPLSPLTAAASPITYLDPAVPPPPFYLAHGDQDCLVPYGQSEQLAAALRQAGGQVTLELVRKAGHGTPEIARTQTAPSIAFLHDAYSSSERYPRLGRSQRSASATVQPFRRA